MMRLYILMVMLCATALPARGEDWTRFLGPTQNGKSTETGISTDWSGDGLPLLWVHELDTSYGIGAVADGRYYQFDRVGDVERLSCLGAKTGGELWHVDQPVEYRDMYGYNGGPRCSPLIVGNRVFTYGVSGRLSCIHAETGAIQWQKNLNDEFGVIQNFFGVSSNPVPYKDMILVCVGGSPEEDKQLPLGRLDRVTGNGSAIVAFRQSDGKEIYRVSDELASYSSPLVARLSGRDVVLALMRGGLLAIDPATGKQLWHFPWRAPRLESVNAAVPVQNGDEIFISECYDIGSALLKATGDSYKVLRTDPESRRLQSFRAHWATPIEHNGFLFGCSGRNEPDSDLRCIRWSDGKVMWSEFNRIRSSLLYVDGHFVVLDERGDLQLIRANSEKYEVVTRIDLAGKVDKYPAPFFEPPCWAAPILADGLMYVRGANRVACFRLIP